MNVACLYLRVRALIQIVDRMDMRTISIAALLGLVAMNAACDAE